MGLLELRVACPVSENSGGRPGSIVGAVDWFHNMVDGVQGSAERTEAAVVAVSVQSCHWG